MLLNYLSSWAPFHIDALGIVTLLGAEEIDKVVGRLARPRFSSCLPLLGAYKIAGNDIVKPIPGFVLYNITDGIMATDLTGWFCRWLLSQELTFTSTTLRISADQLHKKRWYPTGPWNYILGIIVIAPLLIMAILMEDWWSLGNVLSMVISIVVRQVVVRQNHAAIDRAVEEAGETSDVEAKIFVTLPTGELVTVRASVGIVLRCLLTNPAPPNPGIYLLARSIGWLGFGGHVICLGMATLLSQLLTVAVIVSSTVLVAWRVGDDEYQIGQRLRITRSDHPAPDWRAPAMARLQLSQKEEDSLLAWNLFPQRSNEVWWQTFRNCQAHPETFVNWSKCLKEAYQKASKQANEAEKSIRVANRSEVGPGNPIMNNEA